LKDVQMCISYAIIVFVLEQEATSALSLISHPKIGRESNICSKSYLTSQDWKGQREREQNKKRELHNRKKLRLRGHNRNRTHP